MYTIHVLFPPSSGVSSLQFVYGAIIFHTLSVPFLSFVRWDLSNCDPNHPVQCWARRGSGSGPSGFGSGLFQTGVSVKTGLSWRSSNFLLV